MAKIFKAVFGGQQPEKSAIPRVVHPLTLEPLPEQNQGFIFPCPTLPLLPKEIWKVIIEPINENASNLTSVLRLMAVCKQWVPWVADNVAQQLPVSIFLFVVPTARFDKYLGRKEIYLWNEAKNLSGTKWTWPDPHRLAKLTNLQRLDLNNNLDTKESALTGISLQLQHLGLGYNNIITYDVVKRLTNLKSLNLSGNTRISESLNHLGKLETLLLNGNNVIMDSHISQLVNLRSLSLDSTPNVSGSLKYFPSLTFLDLQGNNMVKDDLLARLTNIRTLNLMMNPSITDAGIVPLTDLQSLNLMFNEKITFLALGNLRKLNHIKVAGSKITPAQVRDLPGGAKIVIQ